MSDISRKGEAELEAKTNSANSMVLLINLFIIYTPHIVLIYQYSPYDVKIYSFNEINVFLDRIWPDNGSL